VKREKQNTASWKRDGAIGQGGVSSPFQTRGAKAFPLLPGEIGLSLSHCPAAVRFRLGGQASERWLNYILK